MVAGPAPLSVDVFARTLIDITGGSPADVMAAIGLCLSLPVVVMPAGGGHGWLITRLLGQVLSREPTEIGRDSGNAL